MPIEEKSRDTTFLLGFKPTRKDIKAMMTKKREKRHANTTRQTFNVPMSMPHYLSFSSPFPNLSTSILSLSPPITKQTSLSMKVETAPSGESSPGDVSPAVALQNLESYPFVKLEDGF